MSFSTYFPLHQIIPSSYYWTITVCLCRLLSLTLTDIHTHTHTHTHLVSQIHTYMNTQVYWEFDFLSYQQIKCCFLTWFTTDQIRSDQSLSHVRLFETPWIAALQASLSITNSQSSLKLMSIESVMPSSHLILCRPLLFLPPIPPSISLFQWVNSSHEVAKVLEFQL